MIENHGLSTKYEDGIAPYARIAAELRRQILHRNLAAHSRLESERALAQRFTVTQNTMHRALHVLEQEGLVYSEQGRGRFVSDLRKGRKTGRIGILVPRMALINHPVMSQRLAGAESALIEHGYKFQIRTLHAADEYLTPYGVDSRDEWLKPEISNDVDGLIILTGTVNLEALDTLSRIIPVAFHGSRFSLSRVLNVRIDILGGAYNLMRFLVGQKHRNVALVVGRSDSAVSNQFIDGCRLAYESDYDQTLDSKFIYYTPGHLVESGRQAAQEIFSLPLADRPSAVVCDSHEMVKGFLEISNHYGVRFPVDMSLAYLGKPASVELLEWVTHVEYDFNQMGQLLTTGLINMIDNPGTQPQNKLVRGILRERQSCRPLSS